MPQTQLRQILLCEHWGAHKFLRVMTWLIVMTSYMPSKSQLNTLQPPLLNLNYPTETWQVQIRI